ncbi:hypothetical protein CBL_10758 [Carabus blaptoides fortunei]
MSGVIVPVDSIGNDVILGQAFLDSTTVYLRYMSAVIVPVDSIGNDVILGQAFLDSKQNVVNLIPENQINPEVDFKTKQELVNAIPNYKMSRINCHHEVDDEDL